MELEPKILDEARALLDACKAAQVRVATAESCTGGWLAACLTDVAGSSAVVDRGFVTYSNEAKTDLLGVPAALIASEGAVSEAVARAMAEGALNRSRAQLTVGITGIAGPTGGSTQKPVGLVHFAVARTGAQTRAEQRIFPGDRRAVRAAAVAHALSMLKGAL